MLQATNKLFAAIHTQHLYPNNGLTIHSNIHENTVAIHHSEGSAQHELASALTVACASHQGFIHQDVRTLYATACTCTLSLTLNCTGRTAGHPVETAACCSREQLELALQCTTIWVRGLVASRSQYNQASPSALSGRRNTGLSPQPPI